jgi:hypothetical protein
MSKESYWTNALQQLIRLVSFQNLCTWELFASWSHRETSAGDARLTNVFLEIPRDCRISGTLTPAANSSRQVTRFQARRVGALRRSCSSAFLFEVENKSSIGAGMDCLPSLPRGGYHATSLTSPAHKHLLEIA